MLKKNIKKVHPNKINKLIYNLTIMKKFKKNQIKLNNNNNLKKMKFNLKYLKKKKKMII